ncbi:MAG TPA: PIN domain-containing protein [Polyangiaceae bacterium]|jgi:hypothetical protein
MGKASDRKSQTQVVLDTGPLIALDRGDRRVVALIEELLDEGGRFLVPAGVLGQAWRDGQRQSRLARFARGDYVQVVPLDGALARVCGELLALTGTSDVIDASVVAIARANRSLILTSDVADLKRLDPGAKLVRI